MSHIHKLELPGIATKLQQAITLIKSGETQRSRQLLIEILKIKPRNEWAGLWMSNVVGTDEQGLNCLKKVLLIDPQNQLVQNRGLNVNMVTPTAKHHKTVERADNLYLVRHPYLVQLRCQRVSTSNRPTSLSMENRHRPDRFDDGIFYRNERTHRTLLFHT